MEVVADETSPLQPRVPSHGNTVLLIRIVTGVLTMVEGYDVGVINGAMILFRKELSLSEVQVACVLSVFPAMVSAWAPIAGSLSDWTGRKRTMIVSTIFLLIGGLLMAFADGFYMLLAGRMVTGSGAGVGLTTVTSYMAEVAPADSRGFHASLQELFMCMGSVVGFAANVALLSVPHGWRYMMGLGAIPAVLVMIALALPYSQTGIPESPRWLQKVGEQDKARAVLLDLLEGNEDEVARAMEGWKAEARVQGGMASWCECLHAFCTDYRSEALAGIGIGVVSLLTGIAVLTVSTSTLLVGTGMETRTAMQVTTMIGVARTGVMLVVAFFFLDSWGRRPLLLLSLGICCIAAMLGTAPAFFDEGSSTTLLLIVLPTFVMGYSMGVGPVCWVYMPEVFPNKLRAKGCALAIAGGRCCVIAQLFFFPIVYPLIGTAGLFSFLVYVNLFAFVYVLALCPETKGVALEDMKQVFEEPKKLP